jgi:uncharacterized protein (TIGR00266 family)
MARETAYTIEHSPAYASLMVHLRANQTLVVESGAMAGMDPCVEMKSKVKGGLGRSLGRMLGGESLFLSEFTAKDKPGKLWIAPGIPGDIRHYQLDGSRSIMLQSSAFVASDPTVELDAQFQGFRGFFSGEALFLLRMTGTGNLWFSSFGGIVEVPVEGDYIVDTGYIVAFEDTLDYSVEIMGGLSWKSLRTGILGGEGLVCRFSGRGKLWVQSRNLYPFINFLNAFRPVKSSNN